MELLQRVLESTSKIDQRKFKKLDLRRGMSFKKPPNVDSSLLLKSY